MSLDLPQRRQTCPSPKAPVIHITPGQSQVSAEPGWGLFVHPGFFTDLKESPYQDPEGTLKTLSPSVKGSLVPVEPQSGE